MCCLFFSDVTSGLSFNDSNTTALLVWFGFLYLLLWAGEDAAGIGAMEIFLLGGGQSQAVLENGDRWEMRRVASASPCFQCSAAEMLGNTQGNISCYGISELHCSSSCHKGSSSNKCEEFVCPGAAALCSLLRVVLRAAWGGTCL